MTMLAFAEDTALTRFGVAMTQLHDELWRVTRPGGEVVGYIERFTVRDGLRYRAKRMLVRQRRFVAIGEFWSVDDALECLRGY